MKRRLFDLAAAVSLLLCIAVGVLWACAVESKSHASTPDDNFASGRPPALAAFWLADDSRFGPPSKNAAAFAGRGCFYSWPAHDLGHDFGDRARKCWSYGHATP